ncbi:lytic murein transglycosylase [Paraconexibacter antarcticus]|uniref:Lytic murein transglycosylase n=1 Tax=Paraconexibacter antarcticus TaxID=2949664 RepID=A0ABY5DUW2_9ACTN|nr:lytic murein transglycosylase [Paraconexibacter antarcticus]UTI65795.1 lytic murein transglycosylase [Paraconexibacter antarcticus]
MNKRKLLSGMAAAGVFSAGFGAAVYPASAELQTVTVTLLGGTQVQVQVDVPPGTPLNQIKLPGISLPVIAITSSGPVAATPPAAPPATPPAAPSSTPAAPSSTPQVASPTPQAQATTGKKTRKAPAKALSGAIAAPTAAPVDSKTGQPVPAGAGRDSAGVPTAENPTFSFALPGPAPIGVPNFFIDKFRIPPFLLSIYQAAGTQYGIRWEVLAAINEIETDYGRNLSTSSAGAVGWMQFLPATFKQYGVDANDDGSKDPYNPVDAIFSAARYLKAAGGDKDIRKAIFAYNHADWYVDSVLMRARLIGGLPSDLVGSLTGLTQGHFPVHATASYADDINERDATRRVAKGKNAAMPVGSSSTRRSVDIFAKAGAPVIAVQDGRILKLGHSKRLGRFIQLQDVYGNTYTYGGLKKLAPSYPVPKSESRPADPTRDISIDSLTPKDPAPTAPASAGAQVAKVAKTIGATKVAAADAVDTIAKATASVSKQRLFANPSRPRALKEGGEEQLLNTTEAGTSFKSYFTQVFGLKRSDVTIKPLKAGSKVIAGTILGRIGTTSSTMAPHVRFEIRPAGRGAPRIDPKPILDGWKLLESTAIYRAAGKNPFFGTDGKNPSIGQILLLSKEQLQRRVLEDPSIDIYSGGENDIKAGAIDRRVLATLEFLTASGLKPTISSLRGNHSLLTSSGNISEHSSGNAVDISKINGIPILGHQGPGSITDITIRRLLTLQGTMKPHQIISLMTFAGTDNTLSLPDHNDHIHVGFAPLYNSNSKAARQLDAVLKPEQWIKLISRIGTIENPTVAVRPSKDAIKVAKGTKKGD